MVPVAVVLGELVRAVDHVIDWQRVPWPLWAYCAVTLLGVGSVMMKVSGPFLAVALLPIIMMAWLYFLLRGIRWLWLATLGIYGLTIPQALFGSVTWEGYATTVIAVVLLLLPVTRRYYMSRDAGAST